MAADLSKEKRLLPDGRLPGTVEPRIGRLPWTAKGGDNMGGGILGKRCSEGHWEILAGKNNSAMQKIILAMCLQCDQGNATNQSKK